MQVQFKAGVRRIWRETGSIQIGLSPRRGTVLDGLTPDDAALLERLREGFDPRQLESGRVPPGSSRALELVHLLTDAGLLTRRRSGRAALTRLGADADRLAGDASVWSLVCPDAGDGWELLAARRRRHVSIFGAGRLGTTLAATLANAGVGHITIFDERAHTATDVGVAGGARRGSTRQDVAREVIRRLGASVQPPPRSGARHKPDLVVLVENGVADAARAAGLVSSDIPHLSVVVGEDVVVVGPLVRPGHGPCLRCLDLHRTDRDPAWPSLVAQVLHPPPGTPEPEEAAVSVVAAGLAALQVLGHLDGVGRPAAASATLEIELPDGLVARRPWGVHPRCGCLWPMPSAHPGQQPATGTTAEVRTMER